MRGLQQADKVYSLRFRDRAASLVAAGLLAGACAAWAVFIPEAMGLWRPLGIGLSASAALLSLGLFLRGRFRWTLAPGGLLVRFGWWHRKTWDLAFCTTEEDPSRGYLLIRSQKNSGQKPARVPRHLQGYEDLRRHLPGPEESQGSARAWKWRASWSVFWFYPLFFALVGWFAWQVASAAWAPAAWALAAFMGAGLLLRLTLVIPLSYRWDGRRLIIRSLLARRELKAEHLTSFVRDRYAFAGAPYEVFRLDFGSRRVVLDDFYLHSPLDDAAARSFLAPLFRAQYIKQGD